MRLSIAVLSVAASVSALLMGQPVRAQNAGCTDFQVAKGYTVFAKQFFTPGRSDVQGSIAISDLLQVGEHYHVGGDVRVGGTMNWPGLNVDGNAAGQVLVGGDAGVDFGAGFSELERISDALRAGNAGGSGSVVQVDNMGDLKGHVEAANGITIFNIAGKDLTFGNEAFYSSCDSGKNFVYNFYEATSVNMINMQACGIVLAPRAEVRGSSLLFQGNVYASTVRDEGHFQINARDVPVCVAPPPIPTPPQPEQPEQPEQQNDICVDYVIIKDYTVFTRTFKSPGASDVQGSVAVSDVIEIGANYGITGDLRVGGSLNWPSRNVDGRVDGQVLTGSDAGIDFGKGFTQIDRMSEAFRNGQNAPGPVIQVNSPEELKDQIRSNSGTVVFNIAGNQMTIGNENFLASCEAGKNFVYNFYEATSVTLENLQFCGTVLAPRAEIKGRNGLLEGQLFATFFHDEGNFQINERIAIICV